MKPIILVLLIAVTLSGCAHDTYSFSNLTHCTDQKPFKATKPIKRKCY
jgi:hypothetical protein